MTIREKFNRCDRPIIYLALILCAIGLLAIYSAVNATGNYDHFYRQMAYFGMGVLLMLLVSFTPLHYIYQGALWLYVASLLGLVAVDVLGVTTLGAQRWLNVFGMKVQPSEPAKIGFIVLLARLLGQLRADELGFKSVVLWLLLFLPVSALVYLQPDLGTSTVFPAVGLMMLAWAGLPLWFFISGAIPFMAIFLKPLSFWPLIPIGAGLFYLWRTGVRWVIIGAVVIAAAGSAYLAPQLWEHLKPYQKDRLTSFLQPEKDARRSGYQVLQSKVAIGSGGLWGRGYLKGTQSQLRFLPQQHTDFIFAIVGEELGLVGASALLGLFYYLLWRGVQVARRAKSAFAGLVAIGAVSLIAYHVVINIGMTLGLLPVTGLPLPFISYGGSFLWTALTATGLVVSVSIFRQE